MEEKTRSRETGASVPTLSTVGDPLPGRVNFDVIREEASNIIDRIEFSLPPTCDTLPSLHVTSTSVFPTLDDSSEPKLATALKPVPTNFAMSSIMDVNADLPTKMETTFSEHSRADKGDQFSDEDAVLSSAYDFLKDDPFLLAELSKQPQGNMAAVHNATPMDDLELLTDVLALQRIQEMTGGGRMSVHDGAHSSTGAEGSCGGGGGGDVRVSVPSIFKPSSSSNSGDPSDSGFDSASGQLRVLVDGGAVDFLQSGLDPDQVLDQMQKLKEVSGGILTLDQMDPFLDYFGEISSRELDRIEALEEKSNLKKKSSGGSGEVRKKKRSMAIRFPSQSKAPPHSYEELPAMSCSDMNIPVDKLPLTDFDGPSNSFRTDGGSSSNEEFTETLKKSMYDVTSVPEFLGDGTW